MDIGKSDGKLIADDMVVALTELNSLVNHYPDNITIRLLASLALCATGVKTVPNVDFYNRLTKDPQATIDTIAQSILVMVASGVVLRRKGVI